MPRKSLARLCLAAALLLPAQAFATTVSVDFSRATGVGPFDANDDPGNDSGTGNAIIRTNDIISYKFEVLVQNGDATNVTMQLSVSPGLELSLPAFCRETGVSPASAITGDSASGYSILCNVGDINGGSQVVYALPAKVAFDRQHGSTVSLVSAQIQSDQTPAESFPGATDTVSAAPILDLVKNAHTRLIGRRDGPAGEEGVVYSFPIVVRTDDGNKGNELVTGPISFTDALSGISPNTILYEGWAGALAEACFANYTDSTYRLWGIPRGYTQTSDGGPGGSGAGPATHSVRNSGSFDCTQPASPGGTVTVTITGADLTGVHSPSRTASGSALNANQTYLVAGNMVVWIPMQDIDDAGGQLSVNNVYSALSAISISGQSNVEPDSANNTKSFIARDGSSGRWFHNHKDHNTYNLVAGQTSRRSGDGYILPDQTFATRHYQHNDNWLSKKPFNNVYHCTTFDNTTQRIEEISPGVGARMALAGTYEGGQPSYLIEYGTGAFGGSETCDDADSPDGWYTNVNSVPGGRAAVTKVRAYTPVMPAPGGTSTQVTSSLIVRYVALDNPVGTILAQWGAFKYDEINGGNWYFGTPYDETTGLGSFGDRLYLTKISTRVSKDTVPSNDDQVLAGDPLSFSLQPSATTPVNVTGQTTDVTVVDTLPNAFDYVLGSASPSPTSEVSNPDGTTTLTWDFPDTVVNEIMGKITYDVIVKPTVQDQTNAVNTAIVSSPEDGSPESSRTSQYGILVLNPSGFSVYKVPSPELIAPNGDYGYVLTYANTGTSDFNGVVLIDVLPDPSVTHSPPTSFSGTSAFVSVSGGAGESFEYTKTAPAAVEENPNHASNQPGGSTVWCSGLTGGACPASPSEVTAFRATSPAFLQGQPAREIVVQMTAAMNGANNTYSNSFVAQAEGLAFAVTAPVATARVRTADLHLTKAVIGPSQDPADEVAFALTLGNDGPHEARDIAVRDILPDGYLYLGDDAGPDYDPATGLWQVPSLPVGATKTLMIRARVVPGGSFVNTAEIVSQTHADPDSAPDNSASAPAEDDTDSASILAYVSGTVFVDNGIGGGTAHDALLTGGEVPSSVASLAVTQTATGTPLASARVRADGTWFAVLPEGFSGPLTVAAVPNPGHRPISENVGGLPALSNADAHDGIFEFTPVEGGSYTGLNIGLIMEPTLSQDQSGTVQPGQIVELAHRYTATTAGAVTFSLAERAHSPANAFASTVFLDTDCNGTSDQPVTGPVTVAAGQAVCLTVRTQAGTGVGASSTYVYDLAAQTLYANTALSRTIYNTDSLGSGGAGGADMVLTKRVRNVTKGTPEGTSNTGEIGDTLEYRIIMLNPTSKPMTNVTVNDTVPAYTVLAVPVTTPVTVAPGVTCQLVVPTTNAPGYAGPLEWTCPGTFPASTQGSVAFRVMIAP